MGKIRCGQRDKEQSDTGAGDVVQRDIAFSVRPKAATSSKGKSMALV